MSDPFAGLPHQGVDLGHVSAETIEGIFASMTSVDDAVFEAEVKAIKEAVKGKKDAKAALAKVISGLKLAGRIAIRIVP